MLHDPWLTRWLPLAVERACNSPILEIGCGKGNDTATLCAAGLAVHAFDFSATAVGIAKIRAPSATIECCDIREPWPSETTKFGVIIASLSLHYFTWTETIAIVQRVRSALRPGGVLLCRLNSTEDHNFGAVGYPELEANFYMVNGEPKRFFDRASIELLFAAGWRTLSLEHFATRKYIKEKTLWEVVVERKDG